MAERKAPGRLDVVKRIIFALATLCCALLTAVLAAGFIGRILWAFAKVGWVVGGLVVP